MPTGHCAGVLQRLATHHCSAQEAGGGAEALALLEEGACQALLLDQSLPDLDADELVAMIRTRHPQVEIVFLDAQNGMGGGDGNPCLQPRL